MTAPAPPAPPPPPLELACADFTFPLLPHDRVLALIAALEIPAVDIGLFEDRSHLQPGTEFQDTGRVLRCAPRAEVGCRIDDAECGGGRSVPSASLERNGGTAERRPDESG